MRFYGFTSAPMAKKYKTPLLLRVMRWIFPRLERWAPELATRVFVQLFFTPLHYGFPPKEQVWAKKARTSALRIDGKKVVVYEWGDAARPYLLFIHGWAGRGTQFREFFQPALDRGFRIVAFDGPAHGQSNGKRTNVLEFHECITLLMKKYGAPAGVVGHSFGGTVSLYGVMQGLPVNRVVTIGTPVIADLLVRSFLAAVNGTEKTGKAFGGYLRSKYNRDFHEFSVEWFLPRIKTDLHLMIVHDEKDKDVSVAHAHEAKRLYPSAGLHITNGLGHTRILKDKDVIAKVLDFMADESQSNVTS